VSPQDTRSHNAATNCYRFIATLAGNLPCQLRATRVNFFAAGRSALGILLREEYEVSRGEDPTLRGRSRTGWIDDLDARLRRRRHDSLSSPTLVGRFVEPSQYRGFRRAFRDFRPNARLLARSGSAICLPLDNVRYVAEIPAPERLPWEAVSQLRTRNGVSVLNVEQALHRTRAAPTTDANSCRPVATAKRIKTHKGI
jgi:hypothetical protein